MTVWNDRSDRIQRDGPESLWRQVYDDLKADIAAGRLQPREKLPSDFDLAGVYGVARVTVRRALHELAGERLVVVSIGRGTFVADRR